MAEKTDKAAGKQGTLAEALNAGRDVFEKARRLLPILPAGSNRPAPATLGDAQALVQERQQQALQHKEPKPKQKGKEAPATDQAFPGARVGGANDNSAYWTLVEVGLGLLLGGVCASGACLCAVHCAGHLQNISRTTCAWQPWLTGACLSVVLL